MGFLKRLRKRLAKLKLLSKSKRKSTPKCCECETLKEKIHGLNQQLGNVQKRYQELDQAERQLELLVIELRQDLLPTTQISNLSHLLSELCDSISPPTDCVRTPQCLSELDEESRGIKDFDVNSSWQQDCHTPTSELNEVEQTSREEQVYSSHGDQLTEVDGDKSGYLKASCTHEDEVYEQSSQSGQLSNSAIEFYENLYTYRGPQRIQKEENLHFSKEKEHLMLDDSETLKNNSITTSDGFCQIPCENSQETTQEQKAPENIMERARLAFEGEPELGECDTIKLGLAVLEKYPLVLQSTQPSSTEPPWSVPAPKPPSLFPNIEHCWLEEEINYDDPIEVYMNQQATSSTAPQRGGPTVAMIQAGRMERNPPPDFIVEELDQ